MPRRIVPRRGRVSWRAWRHQIFMLLVWLATFGVIGLSLFVLDARRSLPDPESIISRQVKESTKIYDNTGEVLLYDIYDEERRTVVDIDDVSDSVKQAIVAIEDSNFYQHRGFDIRGFLRSVVRNFQRGFGEGGGGSTITQQLVGNALVGREKTLKRKAQEALLALEVERRFSKDEILGMYLNQVSFGENAYGVESAAQTYFQVPASDLSIAQSAILAALIQRPSYLSPYGYHVDQLIARQQLVLNNMRALDFITEEEHAAAVAEEVEFAEQSNGLAAPHFVIMVRDYVIEKYGQDIVESGGFRIITTLDADMQREAEDLVARYAEVNSDRYNGTNAALVAIDPRDGSVRALIGSANYFDVENEGNFNVATAQRQPGSAFKPFAYAAAFAKGYPDTTLLWDVPTEFNPACPPTATNTRASNGTLCYHPKNYTGTYHGAVSLRQSLAQSLNIPSVKTLYLAGIDTVIDLASRMGITTLDDRSRFGLSLVLGGAEVRPIDLASAYGVFANDGVRVPWGLVQRIELNDGTVLEERQTETTRVLDSQTARMVTDVLSDNNARAPAFGQNNVLNIPGRPVAAKTGTTQSYRDAWVAGYTPSLSVAVWVGNNDNTAMTGAAAGVNAAGPLWNAFMRSALAGTAVESFPKPDPVLATKTMLNGIISTFESPTPHTILYFVSRDNPLGPIPTRPESDEQFANWEWAVQQRNTF